MFAWKLQKSEKGGQKKSIAFTNREEEQAGFPLTAQDLAGMNLTELPSVLGRYIFLYRQVQLDGIMGLRASFVNQQFRLYIVTFWRHIASWGHIA